MQKIFIPLLITAAACCWLLPSLGNGMLWQDEAQTALLARTTLRYGVPIGFDGPNSISQEFGDDYGPHLLWKWHMWLPFYILAGFFKVFGESTAISRLPFALFGVATVVLSYFTSLALWKDIKSALLAPILLLGCIPFVLLVRQCRYYSPAMFFSLLMLDAYLRICQGSKRGWIVLALAGVLLFNSHFIYCGTVWAAIAIHATIWNPNKYKPLLLALGANAFFCLPPVLWLASLNYRNYAHHVMTRHFFIFQLSTFSHKLLKQALPYPILIIPIVAAVKALHKRQTISLAALEPWALPILFSLLTLLAAAPFTPWPFFRYLGPVIAPLLILTARWVVVAFRTHVLLGSAAVILLGFWWPDAQYVYELNHPYVGPLEGIVQLLKEKGRPGDVIVASYEDLPLKFYTNYRVFGATTGEDINAAKDAQWIIIRRRMQSDRERPARKFMVDQVNANPNYQADVLKVPDTPFENREELGEHLFASISGIPPVVVYERIRH